MPLPQELARAGFAFRRRALDDGQLAVLAKLVPPSHAARNLLWERPELAAALAYLGIDALAREALEDDAFPVNVLFLDKNAEANWKVPGHQDLIVPVERQVEEPGFAGWTTKEGMVHVEAPEELLAKLLILRIHLDDCPPSNGALAVVPGSHERGKLRDAELAALPREDFTTCEAAAGDVLLMRPLLVHRSSPAETPGHRRVLHVVYASDEPGRTLRWKSRARPAPPPDPAPLEVVAPEDALPRAPRPKPLLVRWLESLAGFGVIAGGVGVVLETIAFVRSGRGGEIYLTMSGYRLSYIQALVLTAIVPLALVAGALIARWQTRDERAFDRRYPPRPPGPTPES